MNPLLQDAAARAAQYLAHLSERSVAPAADAVAGLSAFDTPLPDTPQPDQDTLRLLDTWGSPATSASAGGRYFGFVTGGSLPVTVASHWLATAWDQNAALFGPAPVAAVLEQVALGWVLDLLGLPAGTAGAFVTGATMANFTALAAARHAVLHQQGWSVEADGLFGAPPITVVVSDEAHSTLFKSLGLLGLGRSRVQRVPVDGQGRLRAERLPQWTGPAIVCLQAGNVNTGAMDPMAEAIDAVRSRAHGAWVHVDGAFGLWARASLVHRGLLEGVECADSWATDAHKWLNVPYDCGLALVRDGNPLRAAMAVSADYLPAQTGRLNPSDQTPELSRRARGVDVWAALRSLGRQGVAEMIDRHCRQARRFADGLRAAGATILNDVLLNQVLVRLRDDDATRRFIAAVQADGTCWCGATVWQGQAAMRISVSSWATTDDDVTRSLEALVRLAASAQR
jgi:glutamate/tyrosine decarboxylase-like PLP-dependent enzyme